jgi:nitroimidazol reductase NimA-like FMN-containing flavoprotein (pyridoxamine 5'-phosphate oxidase superfamily)
VSLFEVIGEIENIETIAVGSSIRDIEWLRKTYGSGRWRKLKGFARIRFLDDGEECSAELHWYEAHGIGKVEMKIKALFD